MSTIEDLKKSVLKGRGLWVGLFLPQYPTIKHRIAEHLQEAPHVTLLHLGKDRDEDDVSTLCEAVELIWHLDPRPLSIELTGVGWFWRRREPTMIAMVNSARLFALRSTLISLLVNRDVLPNDSFGFIPHVTLDTINPEMAARSFRDGPACTIEIPSITVVCGDDSVHCV